jgi:hypothetical protein
MLFSFGWIWITEPRFSQGFYPLISFRSKQSCEGLRDLNAIYIPATQDTFAMKQADTDANAPTT